MFSTLPKTNFNFSVTFILSSAIAFNLDQSKNLPFGKELKKSLQYHSNQENHGDIYKVTHCVNYQVKTLPYNNWFNDSIWETLWKHCKKRRNYLLSPFSPVLEQQRLFQTERICRQQFKFDEHKWWIVLQMGGKHCGWMRN